MELEETESSSTRCVIGVDEAVPIGRAANAAAVIALTLGKRHPHLAGPDLVDGSGHAHGSGFAGRSSWRGPAISMPSMPTNRMPAGRSTGADGASARFMPTRTAC